MTRFPVPAPQFNGQHRRVELGNAFEWLKQGWALFVAWPGQWLALTVVLLVLQMGISIVPLVGSLAASLLAPIFAAGVLYACRKVANGKMPEIADLFHGFSHRASELVLLGAFSVAGTLLIVLVSTLVGGGGVVSALLNPALFGFALGGVMLALLFSLLLSIPLLMALWFSPALVLFNGMPPWQALRASFDACLQNALPFLLYGLIITVLAFFATLPMLLGYLVLIPLVAGSVYAAYRDIFLAD